MHGEKDILVQTGDVERGKLKELQAVTHYNLYTSPNIIRVNTSRRIGMVWACGRYGGKEN
jgi:hypothetical protein